MESMQIWCNLRATLRAKIVHGDIEATAVAISERTGERDIRNAKFWEQSTRGAHYNRYEKVDKAMPFS